MRLSQPPTTTASRPCGPSICRQQSPRLRKHWTTWAAPWPTPWRRRIRRRAGLGYVTRSTAPLAHPPPHAMWGCVASTTCRARDVRGCPFDVASWQSAPPQKPRRWCHRCLSVRWCHWATGLGLRPPTEVQCQNPRGLRDRGIVRLHLDAPPLWHGVLRIAFFSSGRSTGTGPRQACVTLVSASHPTAPTNDRGPRLCQSSCLNLSKVLLSFAYSFRAFRPFGGPLVFGIVAKGLGQWAGVFASRGARHLFLGAVCMCLLRLVRDQLVKPPAPVAAWSLKGKVAPCDFEHRRGLSRIPLLDSNEKRTTYGPPPSVRHQPKRDFWAPEEHSPKQMNLRSKWHCRSFLQQPLFAHPRCRPGPRHAPYPGLL